jgi:phosphotriesterase-related protein
MGSIVTVTGEVPSTDIGAVLMHEHIMCDLYRVSGNSDHLLDDVALAISELRHLADTPVRTVVDVTSGGLGRDLKTLREISLATGLNIVAGCGWYRDPYLPRQVFETTADGLADILIAEITKGSAEGGVRPGIIGEIGAYRNPMTPAEERVLRAGGFAHLETGVPIYTHAARSTVGIEQANVLLRMGVPPERIVIGHSDTVPRKEYWSELLDMGITLGFDTVRPHFPYDVEVRIGGLAWLAERGSLDRVVVSNDVCFRSHLRAFGGGGYPYCATDFFDALRTIGFGEQEFHRIFHENPARLLDLP